MSESIDPQEIVVDEETWDEIFGNDGAYREKKKHYGRPGNRPEEAGIIRVRRGIRGTKRADVTNKPFDPAGILADERR